MIGGPDDSTADALADAVASLQGSLNFLLRAAGALLPLGLVLAALWLGARSVTRRRREPLWRSLRRSPRVTPPVSGGEETLRLLSKVEVFADLDERELQELGRVAVPRPTSAAR